MTVTFLKTPLFVRQWKIARKTEQPCTLWVCCHRAAYTAITLIFTACSKWQSATASKTFTFTHFWTVVTFLPLLPLTLRRNSLQSCAKSALATSQPLWADTMQWTEITVGKESKRHIMQWYWARATPLTVLLRRLRQAITMA